MLWGSSCEIVSVRVWPIVFNVLNCDSQGTGDNGY